jgi:preprotein translocase subunit SecD
LSLYFANVFQLFDGNMRIWLKRFNTYLLACVVAVATLTACESLGGKKEASTLRLHVEVTPDGTENNGPVPIGRTEPPVYVNVEKQPFLNEGTISKASVVDDLGGFAISVQFDQKGSWLLEQYSTAHKGRRVAILSQFGKVRWLAAPVMTNRITDGKLVFTPDATREEADRIVRGLNKVAKEMH